MHSKEIKKEKLKWQNEPSKRTWLFHFEFNNVTHEKFFSVDFFFNFGDSALVTASSRSESSTFNSFFFWISVHFNLMFCSGRKRERTREIRIAVTFFSITFVLRSPWLHVQFSWLFFFFSFLSIIHSFCQNWTADRANDNHSDCTSI